LSILWIEAICGSVQNSMTLPEKNVVRRIGKPTNYHIEALDTPRLTLPVARDFPML
jgi:hypothetical protein